VPTKTEQICRIFMINSNRIGSDSDDKIEQMRVKTKSEQINLWLFSSSDRKWDSYTNNKIERRMKIINPKVKITTSDSGYK
jgi:methionine synthase II (cobalamin-independent)